MAKMLQTEPASSSVARLLDPVAAGRAVHRATAYHDEDSAVRTDAPNLRRDEPVAPSKGGTVKREIVLTRETDIALDQLLGLIRRSTRTRLSTSHVIRVILLVASLAMDTLESELARIGPLNLPSNARDRAGERQQFESILARALARAVRAANPDRLRTGVS